MIEILRDISITKYLLIRHAWFVFIHYTFLCFYVIMSHLLYLFPFFFSKYFSIFNLPKQVDKSLNRQLKGMSNLKLQFKTLITFTNNILLLSVTSHVLVPFISRHGKKLCRPQIEFSLITKQDPSLSYKV